MKPKYLPPCRC